MRNNAPARTVASTTIAVDLGATSVRVVEVEYAAGGGSGRVTRRGVAPLPPGLWNDPGANREALSAAITQALASAGIVGRSVVACLPRRMVTLRFVRLPHAPPEQMRGMVEFEAQQYVLFPLDDVILDYHVVTNPLDAAGVGLDDMDTVLLAAARRSLVADIMAAFDRAGLELLQLSVSALALAENARDSLEPTALIDVEPGEMDVAVLADGQLLFTRASALDVTGVRLEVAERREVEEVVRSFTSYQNEFRHRPLAHVYIGGESAVGPNGEGLQRALTDMLEMPVGFLLPRGLAGGDAEGRAWATAIGMTLQSRTGSVAPINLVPNERAERRAQQARSRRQQLVLLAGAAAVLALGYVGFGAYMTSQKNNREMIAENQRLKENVTRLNRLKADHAKIQAVADDVVKGLDRNHPAVDIIFALNSALPTSADIWLTQFQFERDGLLTLHGETKRALAATQLVLALQKSGAFTDVKLGYLGDSQESTPTAAPVPAAPPAATTTTTSNSAATPSVPQLPAPGSAGTPAPGGSGNPGGLGGRNPGSGGAPGFRGGNPGFGGSNPGAGAPNPGFGGGNGGRNPVIITPSGGATPQPGTGAPGGPPFVVPVPVPVPAAPGGAAIPIPLLLDPPGSRATPAGGSGRQTAMQAETGHLILAGWQQVDPGADTSGGNGGGGNRQRRNRNRQRGNPGGNAPSGDPNASAPGGNPGGSAPGGGATSGAPTYSNGSIFGATPTTPPAGGTPTSGGTGQPGSPNPGWFRNRRGGQPPFSVGTPITTPPGGIQRQPQPKKTVIVRPPRPTANSSKQTLTSFVITCRVNARRADLIPAGTKITSPATHDDTNKHSDTHTRRAANSDTTIDNGGDDAGSD